RLALMPSQTRYANRGNTQIGVWVRICQANFMNSPDHSGKSCGPNFPLRAWHYSRHSTPNSCLADDYPFGTKKEGGNARWTTKMGGNQRQALSIYCVGRCRCVGDTSDHCS